jgi:hypothetical protein
VESMPVPHSICDLRIWTSGRVEGLGRSANTSAYVPAKDVDSVWVGGDELPDGSFSSKKVGL